jgi:hypothetical protein
VDQDQLNPYMAYEGYVVRVPHNPLRDFFRITHKVLATSALKIIIIEVIKRFP